MDKTKKQISSILESGDNLYERAEVLESLFKLGEVSAEREGSYYAFRMEDGLIMLGAHYQEVDETMLNRKIIDEPNTMTRHGFVHGTLKHREIKILGAPLKVREMVVAIVEQGSRLPWNTILLRNGEKLNLGNPKKVLIWANS